MEIFKSFICRFIAFVCISSSALSICFTNVCSGKENLISFGAIGLTAKNEYYVSTAGSDKNGTGTEGNPWRTITHALDNVDDGSSILVKPGTYSGRIRLRGTFSTEVSIRSEVPYQAVLRHFGTVITAYSDSRGCEGISIEGFDIAHDGPGAGALVFHIDGGGGRHVRRLTVRNNILHDSYNNDILKINNSAVNITVSGNVFYNQNGSDEHIDINSVDSIYVHDNIFFNDFNGSGRINNNNTSSYIVIKDSNGSSDSFIGSRRIVVNRNIFLNWEGSTGSNFILIGEDGKEYHEAFTILIENNLLLGNSGNTMRASVGVKGGKDIIFRNNTISGDLPSLAYAMRLNTEGANPPNQNIQFLNNIWSDPTGTMGATATGSSNDFSDTPRDGTTTFSLRNNCYWNGGNQIPSDVNEKINPSDDEDAVNADPLLQDPSTAVLPRWDGQKGEFINGSGTIRDAFLKLATRFGSPGENSPAIGKADPDNIPDDDLLGRKRDETPDIGCVEYLFNPIKHENNNTVLKNNKYIFDSKNMILRILLNKIVSPVMYSIYSLSGKAILTQGVTDCYNEIKIPMRTFIRLNGNGIFIVEISTNNFLTRVPVQIVD